MLNTTLITAIVILSILLIDLYLTNESLKKKNARLEELLKINQRSSKENEKYNLLLSEQVKKLKELIGEYEKHYKLEPHTTAFGKERILNKRSDDINMANERIRKLVELGFAANNSGDFVKRTSEKIYFINNNSIFDASDEDFEGLIKYSSPVSI